MANKRFMKCVQRLSVALSGMALVAASHSAPIDISQTPLVVSNTESVFPNIFFVLDDSGSMSWDYMPDHVGYNANGTLAQVAHCRNSGAGITGQPLAGNFDRRCCEGKPVNDQACWVGAAPFGTRRGHPPFLAPQFNGVAYNPAIRYRPAATAAGGEEASMTTWTSVPNDAYNVQYTDSINLLTGYPDTEWCTDNTFTDCLRNGNYVLPGRVDSKDYTTFRAVTATGSGRIAVGAPDAAVTETRVFGPHYYNIVGSEFCKDSTLRDCQQGAGGEFIVPASVRWCDTDTNSRAANPARNTCQANRTSAFQHVRYPTKYAAAGSSGSPARVQIDFALSGCSGKTVGVGSLTVGSTDLFGGTATARTGDLNTLATLVRDAIRAKTSTTGFTATSSGARVTITAPTSAGNLTSTATLTRSGGSTCNFTPTTSAAFGGYAAPTTSFGGQFERVDIVPSRLTYPKSEARSDCASASHCTYAEEMTNFANWWAYYRTRMQAMKTASTRAFVGVGANRRMGITTLNKNGSAMFLNLATYTGSHKTTWFDKLRAASPNSGTPLRVALSDAGRLYAGRLKGTSIDGVTAQDPMQYSCQRNYTILSTDGFWNSGAGFKVDGSAMDDQDAGLEGAKKDRAPYAGTLADVAAYYQRNDLRTVAPWCSGALGVDVCGAADSVQNMVTFTLGLGANGVMQFVDGYQDDPTPSRDFDAVARGLTPDASTGQCSWQGTGRCTWPQPGDNRPENIDDLWHAAVNGGGTYFSARDPDTLYKGIRKTLDSIDGVERATAAATTSNPNITAGDNQIFVSSFRTREWSGELEGKRINTVTGNVISGQDWSASGLLNTNTSRRVLMFDPSATNKLKNFEWSALSATEKAYFELPHITATGRSLSQFCVVGPYCLSSATQTAAAGEPLVRFLSGERNQEGLDAVTEKPFRVRASVLGDVVNSEAVYVGRPSMSFLDSGYGAFASTQANRRKMVYIGANDGMLHAFDAETGVELWAYVPTSVLHRLYKLADKDYASKHEYFVDGTANVQDAYINGVWRSVLVGSLGAGGRSYFALDVTDPDNPKAMWEFTHANLGLTMGKAEIGKLTTSDEWVAVVPSGMNNVPDSTLPYTDTADGKGYLFVLNLADGSLKTSVNGTGIIATGVGSTTTPAGLGHVRAWYDDGETNAAILRLYGGDNLGNVWRFDINSNVAPAGFEAHRLTTLKNSSGDLQPITARVELGQVGSYAMVFVGTGRYLGSSDLADTKQQSIYGIKDRLTDQTYDNPRSVASAFVRQTLGTGSCPAGVAACTTGNTVRVVTNPQPVNLSVNGGWYVDLPVTSERVNTEPVLALGTLVVTSNILAAGDVCEEGRGWVNFLDYRTGASVRTAQGVAGVSLNGLGSRSTVGMLPSGAVRRYTTVSNSPRVPDAGALPVDVAADGTRRHSWRDLGGN